MATTSKTCARVALLAMLVLVAPPAHGLNVLIADDCYNGDLDFLVGALAGHDVTHLDNADPVNNPLWTSNPVYLVDYNVVIFYGTGKDCSGRAITAAEKTVLEAYIQGGGHLIVMGYDALASPNDPRLADVVRSSTTGERLGHNSWVAANTNHFILNGPYGDFRGQTISTLDGNLDHLTADTSRGAISLGKPVGESFDKIIFTRLPAPGGTVGMWNGNAHGDDWDPSETGGADGLDILRNWLAGLGDTDGDGVINGYDRCPNQGRGARGRFNPNTGCVAPPCAPGITAPTLFSLAALSLMRRRR